MIGGMQRFRQLGMTGKHAHRMMVRWGWGIAIAIMLSGCCTQGVRFEKATMGVRPSLFADLGETFSVPDGMALDADNNVVLAVPNYLNYENLGAKIVTLNGDGEVIHAFNDLPPHPVTGEVHPMGLEFGPDGHLYIADNQFFTNQDRQSRVLRLIYDEGQPVRCEVVVVGTELSNAVRWKGDYLYLSDTIMPSEAAANQSGVYRFHLSELNGEEPLRADKAKHLIVTYTGETPAGADGMTFDDEGNLYCGLFGDGQVFKTSFNPDGSVKKTERIINSPAFECCDGITCDLETGKIYMANSANNSIWVYDLTSKVMQRLWQNPDDNGATGLLDQPCEPLLRGDELLVVNFDMTFPELLNHENDSYNTISKFKLK